MSKFSIIIPVLDEEDIIASRIKSIRNFNDNIEIIIVDGGSQDNTVKIAKQMGVNVQCVEKGRGLQCNKGAQKSSGDILMFLHIDTKLPKDTFKQLNHFFKDDAVQIGTFRLLFNFDHWLLKFYAFFTRFDSIFTSFGDQCIVVRKSFFDAIGGFPEWPLFEDVHFLRCARKRAKIYSFPGPVSTSARMFLSRGILRQQILNGFLIFKYLLGTEPDKLYKRYYK